MEKQLKDFSDYTDFLNYSVMCLNYSPRGNKLLYNYLLRHQDHIDPVRKIREMTAIKTIRTFGEDYYRRVTTNGENEDSVARAKAAMTPSTMTLIGKCERA